MGAVASSSTVSSSAPTAGLWRVGRVEDPLVSRNYGPLDMGQTSAGNRFDSTTGRFQVRYFGTTLQACFGESLAALRPKPSLADLVRDEWQEQGFMELSTVPTDWRTRRTAVRVTIRPEAQFLDVESAKVRRTLHGHLGATLATLGHDDLDVSVIRGPDRRVTRLISEWVWTQHDLDGNPLFAGVRYLSRHNTDWQCWAVFDREQPHVEETHSIPLDMSQLVEVAHLYGLRVF